MRFINTILHQNKINTQRHEKTEKGPRNGPNSRRRHHKNMMREFVCWCFVENWSVNVKVKQFKAKQVTIELNRKLRLTAPALRV